MRAVDIIIKKRDHGELSKEEIQTFVDGFTRGDIPDYQVTAWAMAVLLNGMTARETTDLTLAMASSGEILDLSGVVDIAVDKHSTGGWVIRPRWWSYRLWLPAGSRWEKCQDAGWVSAWDTG